MTTVERDDVAAAQERFQEIGRASFGVTGEGTTPNVRDALAAGGVGFYPLVALCALLIVDQFQISAFGTLGPEITASLGISTGSYAALYSLRMLALSVMAMPMAALVQRRPRRALVAVTTGLAWALMTVFTGFVGALAGLFWVMIGDGASSGSVAAIHGPLLFDSYPPSVRVRLTTIYSTCTYVALVVAPALVALLSAFHLTWRGIFLVMGLICVVVAAAAVRLRDPGFGRFDVQPLRDAVAVETSSPARPAVDTSLGFFEATRRILIVPTVRRLLVAEIFFGMFLAPLTAFLAFYLQNSFNLGPTGRGVFNAILPIPAIVVVLALARSGERWYRGDPARLVRFAAIGLLAGVACVSISIALPSIVLFGVFFAGAFCSFAALTPAMSVAIQSVLPPQVRPHATALIGIATFGAGALIGVAFLTGIDRRFGVGVAIAALAIPGAIAAAITASAAPMINDDLNRLVGGIIEDAEVRALVSSGASLPMLACRHIDFSYDALQVLFDVSFSVQEGEMVALLGTNGSGKSTLLRVISGLGLPSGGRIRLDGAEITFLDPQRRVEMGIMQIAGGKGTFARLTVLDNLRAFAYPLGGNRRAIDLGIDAVFDAFPRLAERPHQLAGTLSGGENQMLALGCAFIVRPKLLLIDELSLGLAPKIVGELLEMVRRVNDGGTAVVLVEQSVNIALSLVHHAYFMEKGEIRFDGAAADLIDRTDLLRSVFLQGASRGLRG